MLIMRYQNFGGVSCESPDNTGKSGSPLRGLSLINKRIKVKTQMEI